MKCSALGSFPRLPGPNPGSPSSPTQEPGSANALPSTSSSAGALGLQASMRDRLGSRHPPTRSMQAGLGCQERGRHAVSGCCRLPGFQTNPAVRQPWRCAGGGVLKGSRRPREHASHRNRSLFPPFSTLHALRASRGGTCMSEEFTICSKFCLHPLRMGAAQPYHFGVTSLMHPRLLSLSHQNKVAHAPGSPGWRALAGPRIVCAKVWARLARRPWPGGLRANSQCRCFGPLETFKVHTKTHYIIVEQARQGGHPCLLAYRSVQGAGWRQASGGPRAAPSTPPTSGLPAGCPAPRACVPTGWLATQNMPACCLAPQKELHARTLPLMFACHCDFFSIMNSEGPRPERGIPLQSVSAQDNYCGHARVDNRCAAAPESGMEKIAFARTSEVLEPSRCVTVQPNMRRRSSCRIIFISLPTPPNMSEFS